MSRSNQSLLIACRPTPTTATQLVNFQFRLAATHARVGYPQQSTVTSSLLRTKFREQQQFIARNAKAAWLAHVVARVSPTLKHTDGSPLGMLGFFAATPDTAAAQTVLNAGCQWLQHRGCRQIIGPIDGDTWHSYRFNNGPHDQPPFLGEPTNPAYYPLLWTEVGFSVVDRYHSKCLADIDSVISQTQSGYDRALAAGYTFRPFSLAHFERELQTIYRLSIVTFRDNFLYDEISYQEFTGLYREAKRWMQPDLVWFALDASEQEIGFLFCIPDFGPAVAAMHGRKHGWAKFRFWWQARKLTAVNFKSIGVLPEHRQTAVAAGMMHCGYVASRARGYRRANLCLIRDGNPSTRLDGGGGQILRRYGLYSRLME